MNIDAIRENGRIQIDVEKNINNESVIENYKGIVVDVDMEFVSIITDYGKKVDIRKKDIIALSKYVFDKNLSQSIMKLKSFYKEKKELEKRIEALNGKEYNLVDNLLDANMMSKFNLLGAKNRLEKSIPGDLLNFSRGIYLYNISLSITRKDEINLDVRATNVMDLYAVNVEKAIKAYAPDEFELLERTFAEIGTVEDVEKNLIHIDGDLYEIVSLYRIRIKIDKDNFTEKKKAIVKNIKTLRK